MKEENEIKRLAEIIVKLEKNIQSKNNIAESKDNIEQLISTLSLEDMLAIDDYIISKNLLTK